MSTNLFGMSIVRIAHCVLPVFFCLDCPRMISTDLFTEIVRFGRSISSHVKGISSPRRKPAYIIIMAPIWARWGVVNIHCCSSSVKALRCSSGAFVGIFKKDAGLYSTYTIFKCQIENLKCSTFDTRERVFLAEGLPVCGLQAARSLMISCKSIVLILDRGIELSGDSLSRQYEYT